MNKVTRMPSLGAGRLAKSIRGSGSGMKLLLGSADQATRPRRLRTNVSMAGLTRRVDERPGLASPGRGTTRLGRKKLRGTPPDLRPVVQLMGRLSRRY